MDISLPGMGITLLTVAMSIYYLHRLHFSLRSAREGHFTGSDRRSVLDHAHAHKQDETKPDQAPLDIQEGSLPPSNEPSGNYNPEQGDDKQMATLLTADPVGVKYDQTSMSASGFLNGASNFVLNQPVMNSINEAKEKVLEWLAKFTMSGAEFDASGHVPGCHPGTRIAILEELKSRIGDAQNACQMVWLRGPAGVGKSAILQSLAEQLSATSNLGATLFFSRSNGRHNPDFVIPTIAYQLAVRIPAYKEYVKQIMVNDPKLLEKDIEHQFRFLVIEPFTTLRLAAAGGKWVILLDGLDECQGVNAQVLFVNLISRFTSQHPMTPLVWIVSSRPEAHLRVVFNSEEVEGSFEEHEVLANSGDACRDVEKFLRAKFGEIRRNYKDLMTLNAPWPAEQDITRISKTSSGLFALATTIVHYVDDTDACDPVSQLDTVLSVTEGLEPGSLSALYTLYSMILAGVPKPMLPALKPLLTFYIAQGGASLDVAHSSNRSYYSRYPLVLVATIFGLKQHMVYGALRKLHSVIKVPSLDESGRLGIMFYHASFPDYLKTLEDYTISAIMRKFWWGLLAVLHEGDSTAYQSAIIGGRPPVPLSWDVKLADGVLDDLWWREIRTILHHVLPQCLAPADHTNCAFGHPCLFPDVKELQSALEKINFSALIFEGMGSVSIMRDIYNLSKWLLKQVPAGLSQSDVVKVIPIRDLDLACVLKARLGHDAAWSSDKNGTDSSLHWSTAYTTQLLKFSTRARPIEKLVLKFNQLQSENPMLDVLVVGGQPSRRCVFICTEPIDGIFGLFYYIPYCG